MPINTGSETAKIRLDSTGAIIRGVWRGFARSGAGDDARPDHRRRSRREIRGSSASSRATATRVPMSTGTYASRSAVLGGGAAKHASRILREKIKKVASHLLEAGAGDIEVFDGRARVTGTDRAVTFRADRQGRLFGHEDASGRSTRGTRSELHLRPDQRHHCLPPPIWPWSKSTG